MKTTPTIIREYESLTDKKSSDSRYHHLNKRDFDDLVDYIGSGEAVDGNTEISEFLKLSSRKGYGTVVTAQNCVGLIQMRSGNQIQILPKLSLAREDSNGRETIKIFKNMLRSLKDFQGKNFNSADLETDVMNLYEVFIFMYLREVGNLIKRGLRSDYITVGDNLNCYKGKLIVREHLKHNLVHQERFYVAYDEYHQNRAENRLIKATLLKLLKKTKSFSNERLIRQHLVHFEMVEESKNISRDFVKIVIDRNTKDYEMLMIWSKVFLFDKSFTNFFGATNACALLFPMERLFESYVAQELGKAVSKNKLAWRISTQERRHSLFDEPKRFALKPDIVLRIPGRSEPVILDTKWKSLLNDKSQDYGISQSDMYQMYAYAKKYGTPHIWLLYPKNEAMKDVKLLKDEYKSKPKETMEDDVKVSLFFIDLERIEISLGDLLEKIKE